ncbi:hypothetical protein AAY473_006194 [Plecturocebus cupreus]
MSVCTWMADMVPSRSAPTSPLHLEDAIWRGQGRAGQGGGAPSGPSPVTQSPKPNLQPKGAKDVFLITLPVLLPFTRLQPQQGPHLHSSPPHSCPHPTSSPSFALGPPACSSCWS